MNVGILVGEAVVRGVGSLVGAAVGAGVGFLVGEAVGEGEGCLVGEAVGVDVGVDIVVGSEGFVGEAEGALLTSLSISISIYQQFEQLAVCAVITRSRRNSYQH